MDGQILCCKFCANILDEPIECKYCNTNYCKKHIKKFKKCPLCQKSFESQQNLGVIKLLGEYHKARNNLRIRMDNNIYQCNLCQIYKGKAESLCYHLAEEHKKELIEIFGTIEGNTIKESKFENNNNFRESINEKGNEIKYNNQRNENNNNFRESINENGNEINYNNQRNENNNNFRESINEKGNEINYNNQRNENKEPFNQNLNNKEKENELNQNNNKLHNIQSHNQFNQAITERNNNGNKQKPFSKSLVDSIFYCKKNNQLSNCECPSHICCKGNCLCVKCMKYNVQKKKLKNYELINKAGRIAKIENGIYHCGIKFKIEIRDEIGRKMKINKICSGNILCPECEILNKNKKDYVNYIYAL